jgi:ribulose-5-phosphate 4-epimerase/fuculose-1-phosphate aldolase
MSVLTEMLRDLVVANRILAHEDVCDAFGHVSIRHPDNPERFFLSCSRSPELVMPSDLIEYDLDCRPMEQLNGREQYSERPIHGAIYQARPDVQAIVHSHAYDVIPFASTKGVAMRPILSNAARIGNDVPVWDIRDRFGDTNILVVKLEQGHDLARCLGQGTAALMRGHGSVVAADSLYSVVHSAIYLKVNARLQSESMRMGEPVFLSDGEIGEIRKIKHTRRSRNWEYWAKRSGATDIAWDDD